MLVMPYSSLDWQFRFWVHCFFQRIFFFIIHPHVISKSSGFLKSFNRTGLERHEGDRIFILSEISFLQRNASLCSWQSHLLSGCLWRPVLVHICFIHFSSSDCTPLMPVSHRCFFIDLYLKHSECVGWSLHADLINIVSVRGLFWPSFYSSLGVVWCLFDSCEWCDVFLLVFVCRINFKVIAMWCLNFDFVHLS